MEPSPVVGPVRRTRALGEPHLIWPRRVHHPRADGARGRQARPDRSAVAIGWFVGAPRRPDGHSRARRGATGGSSTMSGKRRVAKTTLVYDVAGRPYTEDGLVLELHKLVGALYKERRIDSDRRDPHGLRHTRGVELALAGAATRKARPGWARRPVELRSVPPTSRSTRLRTPPPRGSRPCANRSRTRSAKLSAKKAQENALRNEKGPERTPVPSRPCDGTALPDRTGDLQSHNLAL